MKSNIVFMDLCLNKIKNNCNKNSLIILYQMIEKQNICKL